MKNGCLSSIALIDGVVAFFLGQSRAMCFSPQFEHRLTRTMKTYGGGGDACPRQGRRPPRETRRMEAKGCTSSADSRPQGGEAASEG